MNGNNDNNNSPISDTEVNDNNLDENIDTNKNDSNISNGLRAVIDKNKKLVKGKIIKTILPYLAPLLFWLLILIAIISATLLVISFISGLIDPIYAGADRFYNFFTHGTFKESEEVFIDKLKTQYDTFHTFTNREGEFDIPLIISTVNYRKFMNPEGFNEEDISDINLDEVGDFIPDDKIRSFYRVMNDQIGSVYSLLPSDKKLTGHLIDVKFGARCINNGDWGEYLGEVKNTVSDVAVLFGSVAYTNIFSSDSDLSLISQFNNMNVVTLVQKILSYDGTGVDYFDNYLSNMGTSWKLQNPAAVFLRIAENSQLDVECGADQTRIPILIFYQNEELYKEYLREVFIPSFYLDCETCAYKNIDKDDPTRTGVTEEIIQTIFNTRSAYKEIMANKFDIHETIYIPGAANFPFAQNLGLTALEYIPRYGGNGLVTSYFGGRFHPITNEWQNHSGMDFAVVVGTPLFAIADGVVDKAGCTNACMDGYGMFVKIKHEANGEVYYSLYAHMSAISVTEGDLIGGGQQIGLSGGLVGAYGSGSSTGPHLHFEIRNSANQLEDPLPYLKGILSGNSEFSSNQTYFQTSDFNSVPYCTTSSTISTNGTLPAAYAIAASELGNSTNPKTVAEYICANMESNRNAVLSDADALSNFKLTSTKMYDYNINNISSELTGGAKILISIKGGYFNLANSTSHIIISKIDSAAKYLVLDPANSAKNKLYTKTEVETQILPYVNDGVWSLKGVE